MNGKTKSAIQRGATFRITLNTDWLAIYCPHARQSELKWRCDSAKHLVALGDRFRRPTGARRCAARGRPAAPAPQAATPPRRRAPRRPKANANLALLCDSPSGSSGCCVNRRHRAPWGPTYRRGRLAQLSPEVPSLPRPVRRRRPPPRALAVRPASPVSTPVYAGLLDTSWTRVADLELNA